MTTHYSFNPGTIENLRKANITDLIRAAFDHERLIKFCGYAGCDVVVSDVAVLEPNELVVTLAFMESGRCERQYIHVADDDHWSLKGCVDYLTPVLAQSATTALTVSPKVWVPNVESAGVVVALQFIQLFRKGLHKEVRHTGSTERPAILVTFDAGAPAHEGSWPMIYPTVEGRDLDFEILKKLMS